MTTAGRPGDAPPGRPRGVPPALLAIVQRRGPNAARPPAAWRVGFFGALGVALGLLVCEEVRHAKTVLTVLVVAAVLAISLDPPVRALVRRGMRRGLASALVFVTVLIVLCGFVAAVVPAVVSETRKLVKDVPHQVDRVQRQRSWIGSLLRRYDVAGKLHSNGGSSTSSRNPAHDLHMVLGIGKTALWVGSLTLTLVAVTAYLLVDLPRVKRGAYRLVSRHRRARVSLLADAALDRVAGYMLGNILSSLIAGIGTLAVLLPLGVPYPLALAALVFVADLIPVIGSTVGGIVVTLLALTVSLVAGIVCLAYYVVYRQAEDYLIIPRIMRATVDVPPLISITSVLIGAELDGIVGALLAVPVAAILKIVITEVVYPAMDSR